MPDKKTPVIDRLDTLTPEERRAAWRATGRLAELHDDFFASLENPDAPNDDYCDTTEPPAAPSLRDNSHGH